MTDPHSGEASGTILADNFANKQGKPDPGEVIKAAGGSTTEGRKPVLGTLLSDIPCQAARGSDAEPGPRIFNICISNPNEKECVIKCAGNSGL